MLKKYTDWIAKHVPDAATATRQCSSVSRKMLEAFPELVRVRGHYHCPYTGEHPHWWLKTADGEVIDPTQQQFQSDFGEQFPARYVEIDESLPQPTGKCPNCGGYCYDNKFCCSDVCSVEYMAYVTQPRRLIDYAIEETK